MPLLKSGDKHQNDLATTKTSSLSSSRSISLILNIILFLALCVFIVCLLRVLIYEEPISKKPASKLPIPHQSKKHKHISRKEYYYDYEPYLKDVTLKRTNRTRRFFYIDLGCFDGRDMDYFLHFHLAAITRLGKPYIIAFEPDPINFSACKLTQQRHKPIQGTVYDVAVWTENGQIRYATEKGQKSKIDSNSALYVRSVDFSTWLTENLLMDDYVYIKFTIEGAEIPILEKMVLDESLALVDHLEIEWHDGLSPDFEPRRIALECMFDNFGMDFLYMINPVDLRHAYNIKENFESVPKDRGWKLKDPMARFFYKTRKEVPDLLIERLKNNQRKLPSMEQVNKL
ncbi:unnamed protein product [Rotaria sp. Silwood2]|nr:unnamed protein product [Rotaria sp. Silwood2]CAF2528979.1 unnamed protein product [Rotaria sp. Silwood2]CAF2786812.1 unnamed protein product [Rotaria sp. Silwood2]CAF2931895.1 unnamed protein product [Rotaria sp. Silwood2]CAF3903328.1 unnamed protein product [Rotaria sp. Silwood2]